MREQKSGCKSCKNKVDLYWITLPLEFDYIYDLLANRDATILGNPNMVRALAGNKCDLEDKRKVTTEVTPVPDKF